MPNLEHLIRTLAKIPWPARGCISATVLLLSQYDSPITWNALLQLYSGMAMLVFLPVAAEALRAKIRATAPAKDRRDTLPMPARPNLRPAGLKMSPSLALLILLMPIPADVRAETPAVQFNIPAGDALKTLPQFIAQSKMQVMYGVDTLRGVKTNAVHGNLSAHEALALMLRNAASVELDFEDGNTFVSITARGRSADNPALEEVAVVPADTIHIPSRASGLWLKFPTSF